MRGKFAAIVVVIFLSASSFASQKPKSIEKMHTAATKSIASGNVSPKKDIGPFIDILRSSKDDDDRRRAVDIIATFGERDTTPAAIRTYIVDNATPLLMDVVSDRSNSKFLRGDALAALRRIGAPQPVLQKAADMARADDDEFVKSRGEILQKYIDSLSGTSSQEPATKPADAMNAQQAIAFLKSRDLEPSVQQLMRSVSDLKVDEVAALIAAGVDVKAGPPAETALDAAIRGCARGGDSEDLRKIVELLVVAGADLKQMDDNGNTPLMSAAQYCGSGIVGVLVNGGADFKAANGSGTTPLDMAFIMKHLDSAELLITKGATLTPQQAKSLAGIATDAKTKALIRKATKTAK